MVSLKEMIDGAWIEGEQLQTPGPQFIEQLADLLAELHKSSYAMENLNRMASYGWSCRMERKRYFL